VEYLEVKGNKLYDTGENCMARSLTDCTVHCVKIVKVTNPRNIRWAEHVERTGHEKCVQSWFGETTG